MALGKDSRLLTIGEVPAGYGRKATPQLRIQGLWMQTLGFKIGDTVRVRCEETKKMIMELLYDGRIYPREEINCKDERYKQAEKEK